MNKIIVVLQYTTSNAQKQDNVQTIITRHPGDVKITSDETGRNTIKYHVKLKRKEIK